jgi:succinate dehydrogenase / fumarate reductase membrane anchor subunit
MSTELSKASRGTPIGRVRGLGSSHGGTHHWLMQRFTAAGNLIGVGYLAISILLMNDLSYDTVLKWAQQPLAATALALLVISVFWHARLGLQVLMEDYVHTAGNKFAAILALNLAVFAGAAFALIAIARIAFGGAA